MNRFYHKMYFLNFFSAFIIKVKLIEHLKSIEDEEKMARMEERVQSKVSNPNDQLRVMQMTSKMLGCVGIINNKGELLGMITDGDLRRCLTPELLNKKACDVMTKNPKTISPDILAVEALGIMNNTGKGITQLFVVENKKPIGIIHIHDCLRAGVA